MDVETLYGGPFVGGASARDTMSETMQICQRPFSKQDRYKFECLFEAACDGDKDFVGIECLEEIYASALVDGRSFMRISGGYGLAGHDVSGIAWRSLHGAICYLWHVALPLNEGDNLAVCG
jgi:hypothetical protein